MPVAFFHAGVKAENSDYCSLENGCRSLESVESVECRQRCHSPSPMKMSFCSMLWKITAQFFVNTESLKSQKNLQPRNLLKYETARVYMTRSMDMDFNLFPKEAISDWMVNGHSRMPPSEYIECIKVRAAALPNNLRISRYHPEINIYCGAFECLDHIFQVWPGIVNKKKT